VRPRRRYRGMTSTIIAMATRMGSFEADAPGCDLITESWPDATVFGFRLLLSNRKAVDGGR